MARKNAKGNKSQQQESVESASLREQLKNEVLTAAQTKLTEIEQRANAALPNLIAVIALFVGAIAAIAAIY
jgi:hypothetical protein